MTSTAFKKFKSLERASRPSPDPGLGSSLSSSSSTASLIKTKEEDSNQNMSQLRAQFFKEQQKIAEPMKTEQQPTNNPDEKRTEREQKKRELAQQIQEEMEKIKALDLGIEKKPPAPKSKPPPLVLDRRKSADETATSPSVVKLDALNKGITNDIKGMFEENIAIKKGLVPDPNLPQGSVVKMRRKVNPNIKHLQNNAFGRIENEDNKSNNKKRESVPIDKKMFNQFMNKFEDDHSRKAAKVQLLQITQKQKDYKTSWSKKQEEKKLEEERRVLEEIARQEEEARIKAEEEERLRREEEERQRQIQEEELRQAQAEEAAAAAAAMAEEKKKKKKKIINKKKTNESMELPNLALVSNTCSDLRRKFQDSLKASNDPSVRDNKPIERPKVRKLIQNPFEKQNTQTEVTTAVKKREFPAVRENRLGDIKKRFSQFMNTEPVIIPPKSQNEIIGNEQDESPVDGEGIDKTDGVQDNIEKPPSTMISIEPSPAQIKRASMLKTSVEVLKGSLEKLNNSKERLSDAFQNKKKTSNPLSSRPSKSDMQGYLISHVLYDGQVKMETVPSKDEEVDDFLEKLEKEMQEIDIPEEELMNDEYIKDLQKYLSLFEDCNKKGKKKKKKKKVSDTAQQQQQPNLQTAQVSSMKEQYEQYVQEMKLAKNTQQQNQTITGQNESQDQVVTSIEPNVGKVKSLFEGSKDNSNVLPNGPIRTRCKMISNDLIQKFDCPEMAEQLKKQREEEREKRKQERLKKLEEERQRVEAEQLKAKKLEEERLERERQEQLRKEEAERLERERIEEEARYKAAYEQMLEEEKKKAEKRNHQDIERKEQREKAEPAFKQKKVLGRIQNLFQKKLEDEESKKMPLKIGSVKEKANELFIKNEDCQPKQNDLLVNNGGILNSVKSKFESKGEEPIPVAHGVPMKKKDIPAALTFARNEEKFLKDAEVINDKPRQEIEWSWKKKNPAELLENSTGINMSKVDSKKEMKLKKSFDRQKELLDDIHEVNTRLAKKNALKEHEGKMEAISKFMDEIQQYLVEPDQDAEEATFKDDIKSFIHAKVAKKKVPKAKIASATKAEVSNNVINKIKEQLLLQGNDSLDSKFSDSVITGGGKIEALKESIMQQYLGETLQKANQVEQDVEIKNSVNSMKEMFENDQASEENNTTERTKVKKKLVQVNETKEESSSPVQKKNSYEWKYKKKSIQELQNFMSSNKVFVSEKVNDAVENVGDLLEAAAMNDDNSDVNEAIQIEGYSKMMTEVDRYLNAPDNCNEEIEFKEQLEKYLDVVEMPSKEKETFNTSTLTRKPKKLNLSLYFRNDDSSDKDSDRSPTLIKSKENTAVKELQNKIFFNETSEQLPSSPKDVVIHNAGTSSLKRGFEKLNKQEDQVLVSAPKITPQKFFGDDIYTNSAIPLEKLKAESQETTWKWKQKTIGDLHTYMSGYLSHASKEIVESHKNILKADIELQNEQSRTNNVEAIKKITKEREDEMENFLSNVKDYLEKPTESTKEDSLKNGIQSYLDLMEDEVKKTETKKSSASERKFLRSGQVSHVLEALQSEEGNEDVDSPRKNVKLAPSAQPTSVQRRRSELASSLRMRNSGKPSGKVDTSFLQDSENKNTKSSKSHIVGVSRSEDIKEQLVKQFFDSNEPKDIPKTGAPKTKLVRAPSDPTGVKSKPIEPKKVWKPPQPPQSEALARATALLQPKSPENKPKDSPKEIPKKFQSKFNHITDADEKKAAILAQFGCKGILPKNRNSSSSSLSSMDDNEDMTNYIENDLMKNNELYVIYGDRLKTPSPKPKRKSRPKKDSVDVLKGILGQMRNRSASRHEDLGSSSSLDSLSMDETDGGSPPVKQGVPGSCKNIRSRFEQHSVQEINARNEIVKRSRSTTNVGSLFEESVREKQSYEGSSQPVPTIGKVSVQRKEQLAATSRKPYQSTSRKVGKVDIQRKEELIMSKDIRFATHGMHRGFLPGQNPLAKSASFHKFKQSFETGQFDSEEDYEDDEEGTRTTDQRSQIEIELDEIRSNTRLQKMFNINKPGTTRYSALERSSSSSAVPDQFRAIGDHDEDTPTVKEARTSIKNIFEASASKVTYGGGKSLTEQLKEKEKSPEPSESKQNKKVKFSERAWVLDTINKYFDVIDEDEEENKDYEDEADPEEEYDDEEEYSDDESEEDNAVFATQVSAQRFVYPTVLPPQPSMPSPKMMSKADIAQLQQPSMPMKSSIMPSPKMMSKSDAAQLQPPPMLMKSTIPSPKMMGKVDLQRKEELMMAKEIRLATHGLHRNFNQSSEQQNSSPRSQHYAMPAEANYDYDESEDDDEEEEDISEDEYEVELEVSDDDDDDEEEENQINPALTSLLQKSASSSRIRGLFQTVLQKTTSGTELDMSRFKANLGTHLHRRQSITSHTNIDTNEDSDDEDQFEDCSEVPYENNKYYRVPL